MAKSIARLDGGHGRIASPLLPPLPDPQVIGRVCELAYWQVDRAPFYSTCFFENRPILSCSILLVLTHICKACLSVSR